MSKLGADMQELRVEMRQRPLRVLIVGFYGVLNAGDDLLQSSLSHLLRQHRLTFTNLLPGIDVINQFDLLVVGGGSIWPQHQFFQLGDAYARRLKIPFIVAGVSARSNDPDVARRTRLLVDRAALFHVRDRKTAEWVGHPKVQSGVDLFWAAPWSGDQEVDCLPPDGTALAIRSDALDSWPLENISEGLRPNGLVRPWPFYYGDTVHDRGGANDYQALSAHFGRAVQASFSLQPLRQSRLVVTMRYHGLMCAIRAGRPVIVLDVHNKLRTFSEECGMQSHCVSSVDELGAALGRLISDFEVGRQQIVGLRAKMLDEGRSFSAQFENVISEISPRQRSGVRRLLVGGLRAALSRAL